MFALAYVILPFSDALPGDAIRTSLAPFQRGQQGDLPEGWLSFHDETEALLEDYEAQLTITTQGNGGMRIEGGPTWYVSTKKVLDEMRVTGAKPRAVLLRRSVRGGGQCLANRERLADPEC